MTISLYHATVPTFVQTLGAVSALLDKAEAHCTANDIDPAAFIQTRLADDMHPLAFQVKSVAAHSFGAIEAVRTGEFVIDPSPLPDHFAGLIALVERALKGLDGVGYGELDAYIGKPVLFAPGRFRLEFVAEEFLLSFSQPNFHFHATTVYDILRWKGLAIGKLDYLGRLRLAQG